jgi:hypothetical protein
MAEKVVDGKPVEPGKLSASRTAISGHEGVIRAPC